jgi:hypothetical protein
MAAKKKAAAKAKRGADATAEKAAKASHTSTRISGEALPRRSLEKAVEVAEVLHQNYAGKSASVDDLATALNLNTSNNNFKYALWSAAAYGLINKDDASNTYSLAETGRKLVAATYDGEDREARVKAVLTPAVLSKFYTDYNKYPLPADNMLSNVLETKYGIPRDRVPEAKTLLLENARYAGILLEREGDAPTIDLGGVDVVGGVSSAIPAVQPPKEGEAFAHDGDSFKDACFLITPIGDDVSEQRKHADMILRHLVTPVMAEHGLKIVRADKIEKSGLITQQILEYLTKSRLCITDLSFNNPNVFYELGVRHMTLLPNIQIIRKGDRIPFDVSQGRTIVIDTSDTYTVMDRIESAKRELSEHVKNALAGADGKPADDNPIAIYLPTLKVTLPV